MKPKDMPEPPNGANVVTFDGEYWDVIHRDDYAAAKGRERPSSFGIPVSEDARWFPQNGEGGVVSWREITRWAEELYILPATPDAKRDS